VRVDTVAQKLSMVEERLQEQSCLFQTGDYICMAHDTDKLTWVCFTRKMVSVDRIMSPRLKSFLSVRKLQEQRSQPYKFVLGSSLS
jgi:hypothetical protein